MIEEVEYCIVQTATGVPEEIIKRFKDKDEAYNFLKQLGNKDMHTSHYVRKETLCNQLPTLREIEFTIRDYFVKKGRKLDGSWGFDIQLTTSYKAKRMMIFYYENDSKHSQQIYGSSFENADELFIDVFKTFKEQL